MLATPIVAAVVIRVHDANREIASIARERSGLRCGMYAGDLLAAIERFRLEILLPSRFSVRNSRGVTEPIEKPLAALAAPACAAFVGGPRTTLAALRTGWARVPAHTDPADEVVATVPLANAVLALFVDIEDASGLTYDPTVDAVNLVDAIMARVPGLTERLEQSASTAEIAGRARRLVRGDIVAVEKLAGRAHEIEAMASDDFEGALFALPALRPLLVGPRAEADRAEAQLAKRIEVNLTSATLPRDPKGMRLLRWASIAAGDRLLRAGDRVLEMSFDARIAALRLQQWISVAIGMLLLAIGGVAVVLLWRALRRRDLAELVRIRDRAAILETTLARQSAERALRLTELQFRAVFDGSRVGIAIIERHGGRVDANAALRSMFGDVLAFAVNTANEMFGEVLRAGSDSHRSEQCFVKPNGERVWTELSLSIIGDDADSPPAPIVLVHDITEHKTINARLDHETLHDALTALPNRVHFIRRVNALIQAGGERFAVVFVDLDHFKAVNDSLGHHAGDEVLRLAARRLSAAVRPNDFVARLHGDEFAVLLCAIDGDADSGEIDTVVARLHDAMHISVQTGTAPLHISASIGYVRDGLAYKSAESALAAADSAMYRAKAGGRNRTSVHEPASKSAHASRGGDAVVDE